MALEGIIKSLPGVVAGEDLTDYKHKLVVISGDFEVERADDTDTVPVGVLLNAPDEDEAATVGVIGMLPVVAGESLSAGDYVTADSDGKATEISDDEMAFGVVVKGGDSDEVISVLAQPAITISV